MTNPFYMHTTGEPVVQTRGRSSKVRTELDQIEDGFDAVETAKANAADGTHTGTAGFENIAVTGVLTLTGGALKFPAAQAASSDANTLDDYEESLGSSGWTAADASGAGLAFSSQTSKYIKIGRLVFIQAAIAYPATGSTALAALSGIPFTPIAVATMPLTVSQGAAGAATGAYITNSGGGTITIADSSGNQIQNSQLSGRTLILSGWFIATT